MQLFATERAQQVFLLETTAGPLRIGNLGLFGVSLLAIGMGCCWGCVDLEVSPCEDGEPRFFPFVGILYGTGFS